MTTNDITKEINSKNQSKGHAILISFIFLIVFSSLFIFEISVGELGTFGDINSYKIKDFFDKYSIYGGILVAFLSVIFFLILNIFTKFIKNKKIYFQFFLLILSLIPWYFFANQLVYHENRYSNLGKAIISYFGYPLLATTTDFIFLFVFLIIIVQIILFLKNIILGKTLRKKS